MNSLQFKKPGKRGRKVSRRKGGVVRMLQHFSLFANIGSLIIFSLKVYGMFFVQMCSFILIMK